MKKAVVRLFVVAMMLIMVVDVMPTSAPLLPMKKPVVAVLDRIGLRQGRWSMFAPNPVINNGWLTAEMKTVDGQSVQWESPYWSRSGTYDKFVRFRHMNYFDRVSQPWAGQAAEELVTYLMRNSGKEIASIQMYRNRLNLVMPEDGTLPTHDEAVWTLTPEPWLRRGAQK